MLRSIAAALSSSAQPSSPCRPPWRRGWCRARRRTGSAGCLIRPASSMAYPDAARTAREVAGRGIPCSNEAFGDPAPGIPKRCAYVARGYGRGGDDGWPDRGYDGPRRDYEGPRRSPYGPGRGDGVAGWQGCAREGGFCDFRGVRRVRYGAGGRFTERVSRDGIPCNNGVFGDPAPGIPKTCQVLN